MNKKSRIKIERRNTKYWNILENKNTIFSEKTEHNSEFLIRWVCIAKLLISNKIILYWHEMSYHKIVYITK